MNFRVKPIPPSALIVFDGHGSIQYWPLNTPRAQVNTSVNTTQRVCPETHFRCRDNGYCLPVFVLCNGVYDCPSKEDELGCEDPACPGYYRCRGSTVCLHPESVCDGTAQCPQRDDELWCDLNCPQSCLCLGLTTKCTSSSQLLYLSLQIRALDLSGTRVMLNKLEDFSMLIYLDLTNCWLSYIYNISFPNLQTLHLSKNNITIITITELIYLRNLRHLSLSHNPVTSLFSVAFNSSMVLVTVRSVDLSNVHFVDFDVSALDIFPNLQQLNLSLSGISRLHSSRAGSLSPIQVIDLHGCDVVDFPPELFKHLGALSELYSDNYKLCCLQVLPPDFNPSNCHAPFSEISSCNNLLRSEVYRVFLAIFATLALMGNVSSLIIRTRSQKSGKVSGYSVFVTHLCVSDGLMGVYLVIVGVADRLYHNTYLWQDIKWRHSAVCQIAGFLALMSNEMSAFIVCLITLDRFLVIRFPFSRVRFQFTSAHLLCCLHWALVTVLVSIPFFPSNIHWRFYSQTGICIPLPITRSTFAGHNYAFGVLIVLNMVLFIAIAAGQTAIYLAIKSSSMMSIDVSRKRQDLNIARRLITVAATDFLCWFPIGLLGCLASVGTVIPGELNVVMATLVMPLNAAMNPFLYTMNSVLEKRRQAKEERILKHLKE